MKNIYICMILWFTFVQSTLAQEIIEAARIKTAPNIDGILGDQIWREANKFTDFKTLHPRAGLSPSERTEAYIAYDHENIYIGLHCFDNKPGQIRSGDAAADFPGADDWAAFCLDPYMDEMAGFFFMVTAGGQRIDGTLDYRGGDINVITNLQWSSATSRTNDGWTAEIAIPFKHLPFPWSDRIIMRFKFSRGIARLEEEVDFPSINPDVNPHFSQLQMIAFSNVELNQTAYADLAMGLQETAKRKQQLGKRLDSLTFEQRVRVWVDASVYDYLVFSSRNLKPSSRPFHFPMKPCEKEISHQFEQLEYAKDRPVGNLEHFLQRTLTTSFIIIRNDTVIYEKYFYGFDRESIVTSFSVAKSFASTLVGIALEEGAILSLGDPVTKYIPELLKRDKRFANITIKDLLMMSSGIRYNEDPPDNDNDITYLSLNMRRSALENTIIIDPPNQYFLYNNYHPLLIGMILERATGKSVTQYLQEKLWDPLGMEFSGSWSTDSKEDDFEKMESGINTRAIDFAKLGRLFLNNGRWNGKQIISKHWVEEATQPEEKPSGYYDDPWFISGGHYYKYFWWGTKRSGGRNDFHAVGNKGQYIYVSPQKNLIIIRNGIEYGVASSVWLRLFYELAGKL